MLPTNWDEVLHWGIWTALCNSPPYKTLYKIERYNNMDKTPENPFHGRVWINNRLQKLWPLGEAHCIVASLEFRVLRQLITYKRHLLINIHEEAIFSVLWKINQYNKSDLFILNNNRNEKKGGCGPALPVRQSCRSSGKAHIFPGLPLPPSSSLHPCSVDCSNCLLQKDEQITVIISNDLIIFMVNSVGVFLLIW